MFAAGAAPHHHHHPQPRLPDHGQHDPSATPRVLTVVSRVLEKLVARNDLLSSGAAGGRLSAFDGIRPPSISPEKYVERIYKYTGCSPSCFVVGFVYIDRLVHRFPDSTVASLNVHRLVITGVMVASKILDDIQVLLREEYWGVLCAGCFSGRAWYNGLVVLPWVCSAGIIEAKGPIDRFFVGYSVTHFVDSTKGD